MHGGCRYLVFRSFNDMISTVYTKCEGAAGTLSIGNRISTVNSKTKKRGAVKSDEYICIAAVPCQGGTEQGIKYRHGPSLQTAEVAGGLNLLLLDAVLHGR